MQSAIRSPRATTWKEEWLALAPKAGTEIAALPMQAARVFPPRHPAKDHFVLIRKSKDPTQEPFLYLSADPSPEDGGLKAFLKLSPLEPCLPAAITKIRVLTVTPKACTATPI